MSEYSPEFDLEEENGLHESAHSFQDELESITSSISTLQGSDMSVTSEQQGRGRSRRYKQVSSSLSGDEINPRKAMELRREQKQKEDEQNLTFKPRIAKFDSKRTSIDEQPGTSSSTRFDKLYGDALKRLGKTKTPDTPVEEFTFKPKLSTSRNSSRSSTPTKVNNANVVERLYKTKTVSADIVPDRPSFQPTISKRASSTERNQAVDINDRLYMKSKELKEKHDKMKEMADQKMTEECTFAPKVNYTKVLKGEDKIRSAEVLERLKQYEERKQQRLDDAKRAVLEQEASEATFQPKISTKRSVTPKREGSIFERLSVVSEKDSLTTQSEIDSECSFMPKTNSSKRSSTPTADQGPIHERLFREAEKRRREIEEDEKRKLEEQRSQAVPVLHNSGLFEPTVPRDTSTPIHERLASTAERQQLQNMLLELKNSIEMKECTFQPKINFDPERFAGQRGEEEVHERLTHEAEKLRENLKKYEELRVQEELKDATFAPQINSLSKELAVKKKKSVASAPSESSNVPLNTSTSNNSTARPSRPSSASLSTRKSSVVSKNDLLGGNPESPDDTPSVAVHPPSKSLLAATASTLAAAEAKKATIAAAAAAAEQALVASTSKTERTAPVVISKRLLAPTAASAAHSHVSENTAEGQASSTDAVTAKPTGVSKASRKSLPIASSINGKVGGVEVTAPKVGSKIPQKNLRASLPASKSVNETNSKPGTKPISATDKDKSNSVSISTKKVPKVVPNSIKGNDSIKPLKKPIGEKNTSKSSKAPLKRPSSTGSIPVGEDGEVPTLRGQRKVLDNISDNANEASLSGEVIGPSTEEENEDGDETPEQQFEDDDEEEDNVDGKEEEDGDEDVENEEVGDMDEDMDEEVQQLEDDHENENEIQQQNQRHNADVNDVEVDNDAIDKVDEVLNLSDIDVRRLYGSAPSSPTVKRIPAPQAPGGGPSSISSFPSPSNLPPRPPTASPTPPAQFP